MQRLRVLGKNVVALLVSHAVNRLLYLALLGLIGRHLGASGLGGYALASAVGAGFLFIADLGLSHWFTREAAAHPTRAEGYYAEAVGAKLTIALLVGVVLAVVYRVASFDGWVVPLCFLMAGAAVIESQAQLNNAVCRARERMELETIAASTQALVVFAGSVWVLFTDRSPVLLGWAAIAGSVAELFVSTGFVRRFLRLRPTLPMRWETVRGALPYAVTSLNAVAYFQAELLVLALIVDQAAVGRFASVSRLLQGAGYLAVLGATAVLPTLAIAFGQGDRRSFRAVSRLTVLTALGVGAVMALGAALAADPVMTLMYGESFADLAPLFRLGGLYLLLKCVSEALAMVVTASGGQRWSAGSRLAGVTATWLLVGLLTPFLGLSGAILALVLGELVGGAGQLLRVQALRGEAIAA